MKKKKEFFRIRKDRKRKNGANARACTYTQTGQPATVCRFSDKREKEPDRENPLTVYSLTVVLFSKHNRPSFVFEYPSRLCLVF